MTTDISYPIALVAGLISFFSPCILPLVPSYFTFITGVSLEDLTSHASGAVHRRIITSTLAFVLGFSIIFILLGASAAYFSNLTQILKPYIRIIGGGLIIVLGLHLLGVLRINLLNFDKRLHVTHRPLSILGTLAVGMAFGAGWSPCIGPQLGAILILAGNQDTVIQGIWLLVVYSAGLALPFMLLSLFINLLIGFIRRTIKVIRYINIAAGALLVATGLLLVTDKIRLFSYF